MRNQADDNSIEDNWDVLDYTEAVRETIDPKSSEQSSDTHDRIETEKEAESPTVENVCEDTAAFGDKSEDNHSSSNKNDETLVVQEALEKQSETELIEAGASNDGDADKNNLAAGDVSENGESSVSVRDVPEEDNDKINSENRTGVEEEQENSLLLSVENNERHEEDGDDVCDSANGRGPDHAETEPVMLLHEMGFSVDEAKAALSLNGGDVQKAIDSLLGDNNDPEENNNWMKKALRDVSDEIKTVDDKLKISDTTARTIRSVGDHARSLGRVAEEKAAGVRGEVARACEKHDVGGKAAKAAHAAKLKARGLGRDVKALNEKYNVTGTLATLGLAVAAVSLAKGNMRAATATAAVAGTAYVAGEGLRECRRSKMYE